MEILRTTPPNNSKRRMGMGTSRTTGRTMTISVIVIGLILLAQFQLYVKTVYYDSVEPSFQTVLHEIGTADAYANSVPIANSNSNSNSSTNSNANTNTNRCLDLDFDKDMDRLLSKYKQVFVIMPAKAAGSSLKEFTKKCMRASKTFTFAKIDNSLASGPQHLETAFSNQLQLPYLITSHLSTSESLCQIVQHATKDSLIVYSHREETDRLVSSIKEVVRNSLRRLCQQNDNHECLLEEQKLLKLIRKDDVNEIRIGGTQLLTCETYQCIHNNRPNMVYLHYQQVGRLQKLLAKHHCPELVDQAEVQKNMGEAKRSVTVVLKNQHQVELDDWLAAKRELLEYFFQLRAHASCIGTTRDLEDDLLACPHETMQISGRSAEGHKVSFPFPVY